MKRLLCTLLVCMMIITLCACKDTPVETDEITDTAGQSKPGETDAMTTEISVNWDGIETESVLLEGTEQYKNTVYAEWTALENGSVLSLGDEIYLPLEKTLTAFGFEVVTASEKAAVKNKTGVCYNFKAGAKSCFIDGKMTVLESAIKISGETLYISLSAVKEVFGGKSAFSDIFKGLVISRGAQTAEVEKTALKVNGNITPAIMYSGTQGSQYTWIKHIQGLISEFKDAGINIVQNDIWFKDIYNSDKTINMKALYRQIDGIKLANPSASVVLRINTSAPDWWINKNPKECVVYTEGEIDNNNDTQKSLRVSLASEKWNTEADAVLKQLIDELINTPQGDSVIGIHVGGGVYGEWHYYGFFYEPDDSTPMRTAFAEYAKAKYSTIEKTNQAWKTSFSSFNDITVPTYKQRYDVKDGDYRSASDEVYCIDYYKCQAKVVSSTVITHCKTVHETFKRDILVGVFYGYIYSGGATVGTGAETVGASASQMDIETILNSEYIDYIAGPYGARSIEDSGFYRSIVLSCTIHGKIFFSENDETTYLGDWFNLTYPLACRDEIESVMIMRRNYMYTLTEGAGLWYYDFGPSNSGGAWSTKLMMKTAAELQALSVEQAKTGYVSNADTLVVYDMDSYYYMQPAKNDGLSPKLNFTLTNEMFKTGVSFDRIFLFDLKKVDITKYKTVIFASCSCLDSEMREYIKNNVVKDGRTVVFMSGNGYTDGTTNSVDFISELTGIKVKKADLGNAAVVVRMSGITFRAAGVKTFFAPDDSSAEVVASYTYKSTDAVAKKTVNGATVYYFGIPITDYKVLNRIFASSGSKVYAEGNGDDYISVGGNMICIYSIVGGEKKLTLADGSKVSVTMKPNNTMYYSLITGEALTSEITENDKSPEETQPPEESQPPETEYISPTGDRYGTSLNWSRVQGAKGWYMLYTDNGEYKEMVFRDDHGAYGITKTDDTFCLNFDNRFHPGKDNDAVKKWVVQKTGKIDISTSNGGIKLPSPFSDGAIVKIFYNNEVLLDLTMGPGDVYKDVITVDVFEGDAIYFEVNCLNMNQNDTVEWEPLIVYYE